MPDPVPETPSHPHVLVVRGGWPGHHPVVTTDSFLPFLRSHGYLVTVRDSLDAYTDAGLLTVTDLILHCWSMGEISTGQLAGLTAAVTAGTGLAGWHGGIVASFAGSAGYQQLTGGQFIAHPGDFVDHEVVVVPERAGHPIVRGIDRIALHTEQYWVQTDPLNDVLATTTLPAGPGRPWHRPLTVPAVWTRHWGNGRVFVCTVGHHPPDLAVPAVRTIVERGLLWATRRATGRGRDDGDDRDDSSGRTVGGGRPAGSAAHPDPLPDQVAGGLAVRGVRRDAGADLQ